MGFLNNTQISFIIVIGFLILFLIDLKISQMENKNILSDTLFVEQTSKEPEILFKEGYDEDNQQKSNLK